MSVILDPPELGFRRPFANEVTQLLRLRNPSKTPIAFKVKTTAPKHYCVRPNSGRIEAGSEVEVQVLLQAMKEDPPLDIKCRDKFLVQSVAITPERELGSITAIWQNVENIAKGAVEERKIRVAFLPADGAAATPDKQVNGTHLGDNAPPAYGSLTPSYGSPAPENVTPNMRLFAQADSQPGTQNRSVAETADNAVASTSAAVSGAVTSLANAIPTSSEELQAHLAEAKAQIAKLTSIINDQGLRQRKVDAVNQDARERITTGTTGMGVQQQPADGVPVQIAAALCLLSFLLAYFFF